MGLTLFAAVLVSSLLPAHGCRAPLPHGPAVPAAIVVQTSCGWFALAPNGRVSHLPRSPIAGGDSLVENGIRYPGTSISIRRTHAGRFILLQLRRTRAGRPARTVIWRSARDYYNTGDESAFGPHLFAFDDYYHGIYLTDLRHPERLVMRGRDLYPIDFTRSGDLVISGPGRSIAVVGSTGTLLRRYPSRQNDGFAWDDQTSTLYFVQPDGRLAVAQGTHLRLARRLRGIAGTMYFTAPGLLVFNGSHSVAITTLAGRMIAQARWPDTPIDNFDSGLSVSPDGRSFAFRLSNAHAGAHHGEAIVYILHAGQSHAHPIYRHQLGQIGCALGARMDWHGRYLLYSSADGQHAILNTISGRAISLMPLLHRIPQRGRSQVYNVYWRSDLAPA